MYATGATFRAIPFGLPEFGPHWRNKSSKRIASFKSGTQLATFMEPVLGPWARVEVISQTAPQPAENDNLG